MEFDIPELTKRAIEKTANMMFDVFKDSINESLTEYLSPVLAKGIRDDIFYRACNKAVERKLTSERILAEVESGNETKEES